MNNSTLIIFTKPPVPGMVKTRLAATLGEEKALDVFNRLQSHTKKIISPIQCHKKIFYADHIPEKDLWYGTTPDTFVQSGDGLGERMQNAFRHAFDNDNQKIILIGSDIADIETKDIDEAFQALEEHEVVLGPAKDGGYYLIGMTKFLPFLFINKKWSHPDLLSDTIHDLHSANISFQLLTPRQDIDFYEDLDPFPELLE